jgi:hypothetical protein
MGSIKLRYKETGVEINEVMTKFTSMFSHKNVTQKRNRNVI